MQDRAEMERYGPRLALDLGAAVAKRERAQVFG
jgi:hypothetical protein